MRIRINLLQTLRTLVKIAAQVAAIGELVLAAHEQTQVLDLDAARTPGSSSSSSSSSESAVSSPAPNPNDPSAAR